MRNRYDFLIFGGLVVATLSCQVAPPAAPTAATPILAATAEGAAEAEAITPEPVRTDPLQAAVLAHLLRFQRRSGLTEAELHQLAQTIVTESARYDLDPALVLAVMHVESRYNSYAVSPVNALGLMQIMPATGEWLAPQVGVEWHGPQTLFDPDQNVRLGVAYLRQLIDRYDGNLRTALLAYNWGPGSIDRRLRRGTPLPREYAQLVFAAYEPERS